MKTYKKDDIVRILKTNKEQGLHRYMTGIIVEAKKDGKYLVDCQMLFGKDENPIKRFELDEKDFEAAYMSPKSAAAAGVMTLLSVAILIYCLATTSVLNSSIGLLIVIILNLLLLMEILLFFARKKSCDDFKKKMLEKTN